LHRAASAEDLGVLRALLTIDIVLNTLINHSDADSQTALTLSIIE
jgi:hypothetical protein